ncbi:hypothetical protein ACLOJK_008744 [Asimina triloba]
MCSTRNGDHYWRDKKLRLRAEAKAARSEVTVITKGRDDDGIAEAWVTSPPGSDPAGAIAIRAIMVGMPMAREGKENLREDLSNTGCKDDLIMRLSVKIRDERERFCKYPSSADDI